MDPVLNSILRSWDWRPGLLLLFFTLGALYTTGWWRLRRKSHQNQLANGWRLFAYWFGLFWLIIALMSPVDILSGQLFYMHMIQHVLLSMWAVPLILLANPFPFLLWGLPAPVRDKVGNALSRLLHREADSRSWLRAATTPGISWFIMVAILWGWHDPNLYGAALEIEWIHDLEHLTFFASSMLYSWHITGAGPRIHKLMSRPARIAYALAGVPASFAPGVVIAFATNVLYPHYESMPRLPAPLGMSVINDQTLAGIIMWVLGSMMHFMTAFVLIARWLKHEEKRRTKYRPSVIPSPLIEIEGTTL